MHVDKHESRIEIQKGVKLLRIKKPFTFYKNIIKNNSILLTSIVIDIIIFKKFM